MNPYEKCPVFESENYLLRLVETEDAPDLLLVYSDEKSLPLFNSDNCTYGFHCTSLQQMQETIAAWLQEYQGKSFVRWAIIDRRNDHAVGTIELFNRQSGDYFNNCGVLRLDLKNDYEREESIAEILSLILPSAFDLFECDFLATKIPPCASRRRTAMEKTGFTASEEKLIGSHSHEAYGDYYVLFPPAVN